MRITLSIKNKPAADWHGKTVKILDKEMRRMPIEFARHKVFKTIWAAKQSSWLPLSASWLKYKREHKLMLPIWTATGATLADLSSRNTVTRHTWWRFRTTPTQSEARLNWREAAIAKKAFRNDERRPWVADDAESDLPPVVHSIVENIAHKFADKMFNEWLRR